MPLYSRATFNWISVTLKQIALKFFMWIDKYRNLDRIIEEIRENTYDNELAEIYLIDLLERDKEYY